LISEPFVQEQQIASVACLVCSEPVARVKAELPQKHTTSAEQLTGIRFA